MKLLDIMQEMAFQSTPPCEGATCELVENFSLQIVSIHAPV